MSKFSIKKKGREVPTEAVLAYSKANMLEKIGKKDQAIQSYITAGEQNHVKSQYRLGELYLERKQYVEAEKWFSLSYKNGKCVIYGYVTKIYIKTLLLNSKML